ncbi:MAG: DUF3987 domain-containing protein [Alcaligenaceae bacterium]|nr:DUF3987 domain-containing protein [Alcaligenaceae bacterium]
MLNSEDKLRQLVYSRSIPKALSNAIYSVQQLTGASVLKVLQPMLAAMSVSAQGASNIILPDGKVEPLSLYLLSVIPSGGGKSYLQSIFFEPIVSFAKAMDSSYKEELDSYRSRKRLWDFTEAKLVKDLNKLSYDDPMVKEVEQRLAEHLNSEPKEPVAPKLVFENTTDYALVEGLSRSHGSVIQLTSEGGAFLEGLKSQSYSDRNKIWGGEYFTYQRGGSSHSLTIYGHERLTTFVQVQPLDAVVDKLSDINDNIWQSGFLARFLIYIDTQNQGLKVNLANSKISEEGLRMFRARCTELLERSRNCQDRTQIKLNTAAEEHYNLLMSLFSHEALSQPNEASRSRHLKKINIVLRLAGLISLFSDEPNIITLPILKLAESIDDCYQEHLMDFINGQHNMHSFKADNDMLLWVYQNAFRGLILKDPYGSALLKISVSSLQKNAPNRYRKKDSLYPILYSLEKKGFLYRAQERNANGKLVIHYIFYLKTIEIYLSENNLLTPHGQPYQPY